MTYAEFTGKCPTCKGPMGANNHYCCLNCWKEDNKEGGKTNGI